MLPGASVTMARLVLFRLPYPALARLRLPGRLAVFTAATLTEKIFSIAILICVLFESGCTKNVYTFLVHPDSNKTQIKIAIEKIFSVKVAAVNTANRQGKRKRTRSGFGQRKSTKRAIVTLAPGSKPIELFGNTA